MSDVGGSDPFNEYVHVEGDGSEVEFARTLETLLTRALQNATKSFAADASAAFKRLNSGGGGMDDAFKAGSRSAKNMNDELDRSIRLEKDLATRQQALERNAADAFDTGALGAYNRGLTAQLQLIEELSRDTSNLSAKQRELLTRAGGRAQFGEVEQIQNINRAVRTATNQRIAMEQNATRLAIQESKERIVQSQLEGSRIVAETRAAGQRRVAMIQAFSKQIQIAESAVGAAFRATGSILNTVTSGLGAGLSGAASLFRRHGDAIGTEMRDTATDVSVSSDRINRELTSGFSSSLERRESVLRSSMNSQERILNQSVIRQTATIERFERQLSTGILGAASGRSATAGALGFGGIGAIAGGAGLAGLLTSGFTRFSDLQRLNAQFERLVGNQADAAILMQQIKDFAKITPFDLVGVADLAKGFLQIKFSAEEVLPAVQTIADAVAVTGGGTDELTRIQRAIGQVVSAGRLQGDELNQLAENLPGINIRQLLADQLTGGDTAALVAMQEAGELSADTFVNALMTGLRNDPTISGAAVELAGTLKGRFDNLKEQFADFGASVIGLVAKPMAELFKLISTGLENVSQFIRGEDLSPFLNALRDAATGAAIAIGGLLVAKLAGEALQVLAFGISRLFTPLGLVITVVGALGAGIKLLTDRSPAFALALEQTGAIISAAFTVVKDVVGGVFSTIGEAVGIAPGSVGGAIGAFGDFLAEKLTSLNDVLFRFVGQRLRPMLEGVVSFVKDTAIPGLISAFGAVRDFVVNTIAPALSTAFSATASFVTGTLVPLVVDVAGKIADFAAKAGPAIADFAGSVARFAAANDELFGIIGAGIAGFAIGGPLGAAIAAGIGAIVTNFEKIAPVIQPAIDSITGFIDTVRTSGFATAFKDIGSGIAESFGNIGRLIVDGLDAGWDAVTDFFDDINWIGLGKGALDLVEEFGRIIGSIATNPKVLGAIARIVAVIAGAAALVVVRFGEGLVRGISSNLDDWMRRAFDGLADLIELVFEAAFKNLPEVILGALTAGLAIQAFRTLFADYGRAAGTGFGSGLKGALGAIRGQGGAASGFGNASSGLLAGMFGTNAQIDATVRASVSRAEATSRTEIDRMRKSLAAFNRDPLFVATPDIDPSRLPAARQQILKEMELLTKDVGPAGVVGRNLRIAGRNISESIASIFDADPLRSSLRSRLSGLKTSLIDGGVELAKAAGQIGRTIAVSFGAGLAGFQIGRQAGQAGGVLESLLGIGSGAAIGGAVAGPWGAAAGAAAAAVGTAFGTMERAAENAEAQVREYFDALKDLEGVEFSQTLTETILGNFNKEAPETRDLLLDLGFNAKELAGAMEAGTPAVKEYIADLIDGIGPASAQIAEQLRTGKLSLEDFAKAVKYGKGDFADFSHEVRDSGINTEAFRDAMDLVLDESGEFRNAMEGIRDAAAASGEGFEEGDRLLRGWTTSWSPFTAAAKAARDEVEKPMTTSYQLVQDSIIAATEEMGRFKSEQQQINDSAFTETINATIRESEAGIRRAKDEAEQLNDEMDEFFGRGTNTPFQTAMNDLIIGLENLDLDNLDLSISVDRAKFSNTVSEEVENFLSAMRTGIEEGEITAVPQIELHREALIQEMERQFASDEGGLTQPEIDFLAQVRLGITDIINSDELPGLIEAKVAENATPTPVKIEYPVEFTIKYLLAGGTPQSNTGSTPQIFGFGGGPVGGTEGTKIKPSALGLPDKVAVDLPVNINAVPDMMSQGVSMVRALAAGITSAAGFITESFTAFYNGGANIARALASGITSNAALAVEGLSKAINYALSTVASSYGAFYNGGVNVGRALAAGVSAVGYPFITTLYNAINAGLRTVANSYGAWYGVGINIGYAIARGIAATVSSIASAAAYVVQSAIYAAQSTAKIKSPSQVFMEIGGFMGEGMAIGIQKSVGQVTAAASFLATEAASMSGAVDAAVRVTPVNTAQVNSIVEASGGRTATNVTLVVEGNIYGDKAFDEKVTGAMNQVGQMMSSRPRVASGFGG